MIKFSTFYRVFFWKNSFLKIFHKNNYFFSSQVSKGTSSDHCASNGTKIMPMRLTVQEIQRAQGRQNARVLTCIEEFIFFLNMRANRFKKRFASQLIAKR
jgi:hypothetical protein